MKLGISTRFQLIFVFNYVGKFWVEIWKIKNEVLTYSFIFKRGRRQPARRPSPARPGPLGRLGPGHPYRRPLCICGPHCVRASADSHAQAHRTARCVRHVTSEQPTGCCCLGSIFMAAARGHRRATEAEAAIATPRRTRAVPPHRLTAEAEAAASQQRHTGRHRGGAVEQGSLDWRSTAVRLGRREQAGAGSRATP
jgi:hypothetical protein